MKIIVGLGNPGGQYKATRHNAGWLILDDILGDVKWSENKKFNALIHENGTAIYVKPQTFMNESGTSVRKILDYYGLLPKKMGLISKKDADLKDILTVIHDELDLNFGDYKTATDSGSAGHRGVQSIIDHLKTKKFTRIRIGIKNDLLRTHIPPEKFVMDNFNREEKDRLKELSKGIDIENIR